jgi:hypothetical protein
MAFYSEFEISPVEVVNGKFVFEGVEYDVDGKFEPVDEKESKLLNKLCNNRVSSINGEMYLTKIHCRYCKVREKEKRFKKCGKCKVIYYCSVECQKLDWKVAHKKECDLMVKNDNSKFAKELLKKDNKKRPPKKK